MATTFDGELSLNPLYAIVVFFPPGQSFVSSPLPPFSATRFHLLCIHLVPPRVRATVFFRPLYSLPPPLLQQRAFFFSFLSWITTGAPFLFSLRPRKSVFPSFPEIPFYVLPAYWNFSSSSMIRSGVLHPILGHRALFPLYIGDAPLRPLSPTLGTPAFLSAPGRHASTSPSPSLSPHAESKVLLLRANEVHPPSIVPRFPFSP